MKTKLLSLSICAFLASCDSSDSDGILATEIPEAGAADPVTVAPQQDSSDSSGPIDSSGVFASIPGELESLSITSDGHFEFLALQADNTYLEGTINPAGTMISSSGSARGFHDFPGMATADRLFVRTNADNNYADGNCEIRGFDYFSEEPVFHIVPVDTGRLEYCSMDTTDGDGNYIYTRANDLVSISPDGNERWNVYQSLGPGYAKVVVTSDLHIQLDRSNVPFRFITRSVHTGEILKDAHYQFMGHGERPYENVLEHAIALNDDQLLLAGNRASNSCEVQGPSPYGHCHPVYTVNGREIRKLELGISELTLFRSWETREDPGVSTARMMNNEVVMHTDRILTILDPVTFATRDELESAGDTLEALDAGYAYVSRYADGVTEVIRLERSSSQE